MTVHFERYGVCGETIADLDLIKVLDWVDLGLIRMRFGSQKPHGSRLPEYAMKLRPVGCRCWTCKKKGDKYVVFIYLYAMYDGTIWPRRLAYCNTMKL